MNLKLKNICRLVPLNKNTVKDIFKNVLTAIKKIVKKDKSMLGGENVIVEIDESLFGKRKNNRGSRRNPVWVVGAVERTTERKIKLCTTKNRSKLTLKNIINKWINNRSILYSDCWKGYCDAKYFVKEHKTVNHSIGFLNIINNVHTNTIEGNWTAVRSIVPKRYRNKKKHFKMALLLYVFTK